MEKRFAHGLQFQLSYTWSKSFDQASSFENILNPVDYRRSYSLSLFDTRNRFVYSYYWELLFRVRPGLVGKLINSWALSGITFFQTGSPVRITSSDDLELMNSFDFELPGEPDLVRRFFRLNPRGPGNLAFDPSAPTPQAFGTIGTSPQSVCCGPGINDFDIGLHKRTSLTERTSLEFRAEFFNIVNHAQFMSPDGNISDGTDFGRVKQARDPRLIQFGMKLFFWDLTAAQADCYCYTSGYNGGPQTSSPPERPSPCTRRTQGRCPRERDRRLYAQRNGCES